MITKEKSPIRVLFFRDHEISGLRPAADTEAGQRPQHFKPCSTGATCAGRSRRVTVRDRPSPGLMTLMAQLRVRVPPRWCRGDPAPVHPLDPRPRRRQKKVVLSAWESGPSGPVAWPDLRGGVFASDRGRLLATAVNGPLMAPVSPQGSPPCRAPNTSGTRYRLSCPAGYISNHDRQEEEGSHLLGLRAQVASGGPEMRPVAGHEFLERTRHGGWSLGICGCTAEPSLPKLV